MFYSCTWFLLFLIAWSVDSFLILKHTPSTNSCTTGGLNTSPQSVLKFSHHYDVAPAIDTALCIVPPEDSWDMIQRARHIAKDKTYTLWPPAIRLFHPIGRQTELNDQAFDISRIIEQYKIKPFKLSLKSISVIPHTEAINAGIASFRALPPEDYDAEYPLDSEQQYVQDLIEKETEIGRQRLNSRDRGPSYGIRKKSRYRSKFIKDVLDEQQRKMFDEFNGPCVVILEPDKSSCERLEELREILRQECFQDFSKFSPTSSFSSPDKLASSLKEGESDFRPVLPLGSFPDTSSGVEFAKKMKETWRPITFRVEDLQLISNTPDLSSMDEQKPSRARKTGSSGIDDTSHRSSPYGCDAAVMLLGEEIEQHDEVNELLANYVAEEGLPGGADTSAGRLHDGAAPLDASLFDLSTLEEDEEDEKCLSWLDDDDESDYVGSSVVIGRTHFFTGEMREYASMPALRTYRHDT